MNKIVVMGRLTKDWELKYSTKGMAYSKNSIAVNRKFDKEKTDFFNVVAFGKTAEVAAEYTRKGNRILVTGAMQMDKVDDKVYWNLNINEIDFVDTGEKEKKGVAPAKAPVTTNSSDDTESFPF